jgi:hypothetical protein
MDKYIEIYTYNQVPLSNMKITTPEHCTLIPVILATQTLGQSQFEGSQDKQFVRSYLKITQHKKRVAEWLKWLGTWLASMGS